MLTIQVTQEQLKKTAVRKALDKLLTAMLATHKTPKTSKTSKPKAKVANKTKLKLTIQDLIEQELIDAEIVEEFSEVLNTPKTLYFVHILKQNKVLTSKDATKLLKKTFPSASSWTISGVTGTICRAYKKLSEDSPVLRQKDSKGNMIYAWSKTEHSELDA